MSEPKHNRPPECQRRCESTEESNVKHGVSFGTGCDHPFYRRIDQTVVDHARVPGMGKGAWSAGRGH